jgi:hypothetical protein
LNPLFANWRKRIRGYSRRPIRPVHGAWRQLTSEDPAAQKVSQTSSEAENGDGSRGQENDVTHDAPVVLEFPTDLEARTSEPPPSRPRGPLSWAYWSARKN